MIAALRRLCLLLSVLVAGCGAAGGAPAPASPSQPAPLRARDLSYLLLWRGEAIGVAREILSVTEGGHQLVRRERLHLRRGDRSVELAVAITIDVDPDGRARQVEVVHRSGGTTRRDRARRAGGHWRVEVEGEAPRREPGDAVPVELVPHLPAARFAGAVLLSGQGFAAATLEVEATAPDRRRAVLSAGGGRAVTEVRLDGDGAIAHSRGPGPLGARRVARESLPCTAPGQPCLEAPGGRPPELALATALPVRGEPGATLELRGAERPPPAPVPNQEVEADGGTWRLRALPAPPLPASRARELGTLARVVAARLADDLGTSAGTTAEALARDRGDCTAHALLFAELAAARGVTARLVTGFRSDGDRLVRHRWVLARIGAAWVAVDPSRGEVAPPPGTLFALSVHPPTAAAIAIADLGFAGLDAVRARFVP